MGPAKEHALNMVLATAIALQNETQAHRINTSALGTATTAQIAYNQAIASQGSGAGGFDGSISGDVVSGLGLQSMDTMREELAKASYGSAWADSPWMGASDRDVMAEWWKLKELQAGRDPDWDKFYDDINQDRAERGEDPITVMDVKPAQKASDLKSQLESMDAYDAAGNVTGKVGSIMDDEGNIKDWAQPLFDAIEGFEGFQHGANFTVPAGFNNDSFLMGVSSGEHVKVTPSHMNSGQGGLMIRNLNVYGVQTASELYEAIIQQARMRGKDFAKVL